MPKNWITLSSVASSFSAYRWTSHPDGSVETDGGLALRTPDLAKIGRLAVNGGECDGQRVVPENWIRESTSA